MTKQSPGYSLPKVPTYQELPTAKWRAVRSAPELAELCVQLEVVTPILGGSYKTRAIDDIDVIRAPSVRGHLRFWWRALYASHCSSTEELYQRESELWGRAATDDGGRSAVEVRVSVERIGGSINGDPLRETGAYALWPARAPSGQKDHVPRRTGTEFCLAMKVAEAPKIQVISANGDAVELSAETQVRNALRAWILFGGYGGRTRRGLGSLKVLGEPRAWLPSSATRQAFTTMFGLDIFATPTKPPGDVPWFEGAAMQVGQVDLNAEKAWTVALNWLKEFRQGTTGAREPSSDPKRPGRSNWPEADKIRHIKNKTTSHSPRHNATVAWPRAGFGLPIIGQFHTTDRQGKKNAYDEPGKFEVRWRSPKTDNPREFDERDRLASPLIVKALPIVDDKGTVAFVPCALWLNRSYPSCGQVGLAQSKLGRPNEKEVDPATAASFYSTLVANGDTARFSALANKTSLRQAFLDWLQSKYQTIVVAP